MNDEQVVKLMTVLTEIRDELRLVRSAVIPSDEPWDLKDRLRVEEPWSLKNRLRDASLTFDHAQIADRYSSIEEFDTALQAIYKGL